jgi:DNA (cytosine-5)-methyltransferase 1
MEPTYNELLNSLKPLKSTGNAPVVYDLFAGCGGLGLGFEAAGFRTVGFEMSEDACATYNRNLHGSCNKVILHPGQDLGGKPDVIIGGPPCQPFSVGGLQNGKQDERNGFPAFLSAVEKYAPRFVLFENVRGMLYKNHKYLDLIQDQLRSLGYIVEHKLYNAVRFGVPQNRERLIVVGHRGAWRPPKPSLQRHFTAGEALGELAMQIPPNARFLTPSMDEYVAKYERASKCINPRDLHLHLPSRTVTCRNLYGATGDMLRIRLLDGRRRMLTVREAARLQSFPDWFEFAGSEESQFQQIGNAVPPLLAKALAVAVRTSLMSGDLDREAIRLAAESGKQFELGI